jgi:hypothetical protein
VIFSDLTYRKSNKTTAKRETETSLETQTGRV